MAVPSSGPLDLYGDIATELGVAQNAVSLRAMSQIAGFSTPDEMSEFYGYSSVNYFQEADIFGDGSGIALYNLDGNVGDLSGNYNGRAYTQPIYQAGKFDLSLKLPSQSSTGVWLQNIPDRMLVNSVSFWFKKPSNHPTGEKLLFWLRDGLHTWIGFNNNLLVTRTFNGSTESLSNGISVNDNQWYHFCLVSNGSTKSIYLNGANYQDYSQADYNTNDGYARTWLYHYNTSGISSTCELDQVRIFNKALSPTEVNALFFETPGQCAPQPSNPSGTIANWKLEGNSNDSVGSYNLTANNIVYTTGKFCKGAFFDGAATTGGWLDNYTIANQMFRGNFTLSFWVYQNQNGNGEQMYAHAQDDNNGHLPYLEIRRTQSQILMALRLNNSAGTSVFTNVAYDTWTMITLVVATNQVRFYINGSPIKKQSVVNDYVTNFSGPLSFGRARQNWINNSFYYLNGRIDNPIVLNRALEDFEVTNLYNL